jgi:hypothetical protein
MLHASTYHATMHQENVTASSGLHKKIIFFETKTVSRNDTHTIHMAPDLILNPKDYAQFHQKRPNQNLLLTMNLYYLLSPRCLYFLHKIIFSSTADSLAI